MGMVLEDFGNVGRIGEIVFNDLDASWMSIDKVCDIVFISFVGNCLLTRHSITLSINLLFAMQQMILIVYLILTISWWLVG